MMRSSELEKPSLERLKGLDKLRDLPTQLQEAEQLCTHRARADMILKWLLDRLQENAETRKSPQAWRLLCSTLRLLPAEGVVRLLNANHFLETVELCVGDLSAQWHLLVAVNSALLLLMELGNGPRGASIRALLSMDAFKAASLVGAWVGNVARHLRTNPDATKLIIDRSMLDAAIQIWAQRKRHPDEDVYFSNSCLVSAAHLLTSLRGAVQGSTQKRKRSTSSSTGSSGYVTAVESIIAKHIFMPARAALMISNERSTKQLRSVDASTVLDERLASLKAASSAHGGESGLFATVLPCLLDVALRCAAVTSPKQRLRERPWVESVFSALLACAQPIDHFWTRAALVSMLSVVQIRASLSTETLSRLTESYAILNGDKTDWDLIAMVIELDPKVYLDTEKAKTLFDNLTAAVLVLYREAMDGPLQGEQLILHTRLKQAIIFPVMRSYATNRALPGFVKLWRDALEKDWPLTSPPIWFELDEAFSPLLTSLTDAQISDLFQKVYQPVKEASSGKVPDNVSKDPRARAVQGGVVILQSITAGLHRDEPIDMVREPLENVLDDLLALPLDGVKRHRHFWCLLHTIFQLWYPRWVSVSGRTTDDASHKGMQLLQCQAVQEALDFSKSVRKAELSNAQLLDAVECAELFVAGLCNAFYRFSGCETQVAKVLKGVVNAKRINALLLYADLLPLAISDTPGLLLRWIQEAVADYATGKPLAEAMVHLDALVVTFEDHAQANVIEELLKITLSILETEAAKETHALALRLVALRVLDSLHTLDTTQRERVIMALLIEHQTSGSSSTQVVEQQLIAMLRHLEMTQALAKLFAQPGTIRTLMTITKNLSDVDRESVGKDIMNGTTTDTGKRVPDLMEHLLCKIVSGLVAPQHQERSRKAILTFAEEVKRQTQSHKAVGRLLSESLEELMLVKAVITEVERAAGLDAKDQLPYRTAKYISNYLDGLLESLGHSNESDLNYEESCSGYSAYQRMDALLSTPRQLLVSLGLQTYINRITAVVEVSLGYAQDLFANPDDSSQPSEKVMSSLPSLLRCFKTASEDGYFPTAWYNNGGSFAGIAKAFTSLKLLPREQDEVVRSFELGLCKLDSNARVAVMDELSCQGVDISTHELLLLQHAMTVQLKDDLQTQITLREASSRVIQLIEDVESIETKRQAISCLVVILKKPSLATQSVLERTIAAMSALLHTPLVSVPLFADVCGVFTVMLNHHRSRLSDRFNLLVTVLQSLVSSLFHRAKGPALVIDSVKARDVSHAHLLVRLLQLLCNPPQHQRRNKRSELIDEARKMQAHVGRHVQYVLHHYCRQVLQGAPGEGMREALLPGLWATVEAIEVNNSDGVKILGAAMNNSERAVLRDVYDEYKAVGKWQGA